MWADTKFTVIPTDKVIMGLRNPHFVVVFFARFRRFQANRGTIGPTIVSRGNERAWPTLAGGGLSVTGNSQLKCIQLLSRYMNFHAVVVVLAKRRP